MQYLFEIHFNGEINAYATKSTYKFMHICYNSYKFLEFTSVKALIAIYLCDREILSLLETFPYNKMLITGMSIMKFS